MRLSEFIGEARAHLRDQPCVWVTGVTCGHACEGHCENGVMFRLEHCALCSNRNIGAILNWLYILA